MNSTGSFDQKYRKEASANPTDPHPRPQPPQSVLASSSVPAPPRSPREPAIIRAFCPADAPAFRALNEAWIQHWFALEPEDIELLSDPEGQILARGGEIFVATANHEVVGCFALLPLSPDVLRLARMTVREDQRGQGLGRMLLNHAIAVARSHGAQRLVLETSRKLESAVRLYQSAGFRFVAPDPAGPPPLARANLYMELRFSYG